MSRLGAVGLLLGLLATLTLTVSPPGLADPPACATGVGLDSVSYDCPWSHEQFVSAASSGDGHTWVVTVQCGNGGICAEHVECVENGQTGLWHDVFMDGADVGDVCVPDDEVEDIDIAALAASQFKTLSWPMSKLRVQPPKGQTLVNLETIFYTDNDAPRTHVVVIGGRNVTIEATQLSYIWMHGDGSKSQTSSPGHPYPDHDVFHVYESAEKVEARVDTVYGNGRFRIGSGEWRSIPGSPTLTVVGPMVELEILEAKPQLVIR